MNTTTNVNNAYLSVVMPVYNEAATLALIIDQVLKIPGLLELIIVDDCSTDGSAAIAQATAENDERVVFTRHERNGGKTEALKTGIAMSVGQIVIIQDADLEYDPREIADVIGPILERRADVVYGSRFMVKKAARVLYFSHYLANKVLTFICNIFTNLNMSDIETCYKAFRGDIIRELT